MKEHEVACAGASNALLNYYSMGINPGSFGYAILLQDYALAKNRAHPLLSDKDVSDFITAIEETLPTMCYGNEEQINKWIEYGGVKGLREKGEDELLMAIKLEVY